jgi:antitoxin VapB
MALSLKDPDTDRLAREVAQLTGESLTEAIRRSLAERLERELVRRGRPRGGLVAQLDALARDCAALPDHGATATSEAIGYDEHGVWR